jgi:DNA-binding MarR family transcriptional regulator
MSARAPALTPAAGERVRETCLCLHLQRAARAVARRYDEALRPAELTNEQFSLLMSLTAPAPPAIGALAHALSTDRTTLTANLKPLERRGLVATTPDESDRRARRVRLTAEGRRVLALALPLWERAQAAAGARRARTPVAELRATLRSLAEQ